MSPIDQKSLCDFNNNDRHEKILKMSKYQSDKKINYCPASKNTRNIYNFYWNLVKEECIEHWEKYINWI